MREIVTELVEVVAWNNGDGDETVPMMILNSMTRLEAVCESLMAVNGDPIDGLSFRSRVSMVHRVVNLSIP